MVGATATLPLPQTFVGVVFACGVCAMARDEKETQVSSTHRNAVRIVKALSQGLSTSVSYNMMQDSFFTKKRTEEAGLSKPCIPVHEYKLS